MQSIWQANAPLPNHEMGQNPIFWHSKPDFVSLLSEKYGTDLGDDCAENAPDLQPAQNSPNSGRKEEFSKDAPESDKDADNDQSECNLLQSKARGRHQSQAASLRISKIEKILSSRTDLTKQ